MLRRQSKTIGTWDTNMIKYILACLAIYFSLLIAVSCSKKITNPKTSYNEKAINISVLPLTYTA